MAWYDDESIVELVVLPPTSPDKALEFSRHIQVYLEWMDGIVAYCGSSGMVLNRGRVTPRHTFLWN